MGESQNTRGSVATIREHNRIQREIDAFPDDEPFVQMIEFNGFLVAATTRALYRIDPATKEYRRIRFVAN